MWVVYTVDDAITTEAIIYFSISTLFFIIINMDIRKNKIYPGDFAAVWRAICRHCGGTVEMYEATADGTKKID